MQPVQTVGESQNQQVITDVLARSFGGDEPILEALLDRFEPTIDSDALILALCKGWPESSVIDELYAELQTQKEPVSLVALYAVVYGRIPDQELPDRLRRDLDEGGTTSHEYISEALDSAIRSRLTRDAGACEALEDRLNQGSLDANLTATVPRLLSRTRGLSTQLRKWCETEYERQVKLRSPEIGFDLTERSFRGVALSLLDSLDVLGRRRD